MVKKSATFVLLLAGAVASAPANADPYICVGALTELEALFHAKQDEYFRRSPPDGKLLRIEYDGCGYRIHVGESSPNSRDGDVLFVDRFGRVTKVVHRR